MAEPENIQDEKPAENLSEVSILQQGKLPAATEADSLDTSLNDKPQSENMEIHKHPHHVTHKKKWGEYLLEFLMLFLAVFLGFVAENIREDFVEKHREKQFMSTMIRDLELDSIQFSAIRKYNANKLKLADSAIMFFALHSTEKIPVSVYRNAFELIKGGSFFQNSGTIDQLKNSGSLRLITKKIVVDSIQSYDQQMRRLIVRDKFEIEESVKQIDLLQKLFEGTSLSKIFVDTMYYKNHPDIKNTFTTLNYPYLSEYLNHLIEYRFLIFEDMKLRDQIALKAANLIMLIKKNYHFGNK